MGGGFRCFFGLEVVMQILLIVFLSFSSIAYAYDEKYMRCGNGIIERGMSISKVAKVCGNLRPAKKTPYTKIFHTNDGSGEVKIYHY